MKIVALLLTAALMAVPAAAQEAPAAPAKDQKLESRDPQAVRCRRLHVTGSLVRKERVCKTNAEWSRSNDQQRNDADDFITRSRSGMNPNG